MSGKSVKDIKLKGFSAVAIVAIATVLAGCIGFFGRFFGKSPTPPIAVENFGNSLDLAQPLADAKGSEDNIPLPPAITPKNGTVQPKADPKAIAARQGVLRVSNSTDHSIRVAILLQKNLSPESNSPTAYEPPAHWDFDPGEGSTKGLLLSLPNRRIKLKKGDVLVAFAQDGSRRYWGPYVIGETPTPTWTSKTAEWQLTLEQ